MPDEGGDKTEPATPRRRQEAFESGQFAKSADLTSAVLLFVGLLVLSWTGRSMVTGLSSVMQALLGPSAVDWGDPRGVAVGSLKVGGPEMLRMLWPIMLAVALAALVTSGMQVGFRITTRPLMPNLAKLNPVQGLGKMFAGQNWLQLAMNMVKLALVVGIAWNRVNHHIETIVGLSGLAFPANFAAACTVIFDLAWRISIALMLLAVADWIYHKWQFERDIRMSKQEVKDESKRMEGDMETKGRRRQIARKMIMQRIHRDVPQADVVVTNPTELAIALKYDPDGMGAPRVVAKGAGFLAARIRQLAIQSGVPIVERKPLAQALYKTVDVGQEVPAEFYQAIAEILAYVYELAGKGRTLRKAG